MALKASMKGRGPLVVAGLLIIIAATGIFLIPQVVLFATERSQAQPIATHSVPSNNFPVSVIPSKKEIVVNIQANDYFNEHDSSLTASVGNFSELFSWVASILDNTSLYQSLASADGRLVTILPGYRKEQVAVAFGNALGWDTYKEDKFLADVEADTAREEGTTTELTEGVFEPGTYAVSAQTTTSDAASLVTNSFDEDILSHYSSSTEQQVPLSEALTIASLLEREASGPSDMRIISGIIWNRLFNNMNLQIDATLQYAKASEPYGKTSLRGEVAGNWWPAVLPKDKYIKSPYNTYENPGLPPGPIATPSVAAVLAALNPVPTSCLYYFHDSNGNFHCSDTYAEHVALLKEYYGQGK